MGKDGQVEDVLVTASFVFLFFTSSVVGSSLHVVVVPDFCGVMEEAFKVLRRNVRNDVMTVSHSVFVLNLNMINIILASLESHLQVHHELQQTTCLPFSAVRR